MLNRSSRHLAVVPALTVALGIALSGPASADGANAEAAAALSRLAAGKGWAVEWSASGRDVRHLKGGPLLKKGDLGAGVAAFLKAGRSIFGLEGFDLVAVADRQGHGSHHLSFAKTFAGKPVFNVIIDVHVRANGEVFGVTSNSRSLKSATAPAAKPALTQERAVALAKASLATPPLSDKAGAPLAVPDVAAAGGELGYFETDGGLVLAWRVNLGPVEYVIDASSGAVLGTRIFQQSAKGSGRVFTPNPVNTLNDSTLTDRDNSNYGAVFGAYKIRPLRDITVTTVGGSSRYKLAGPYVRMIDLGERNVPGTCMGRQVEVRQPPPVRQDSAFLYNRSQPGFEHTMVYYTIDASQRYIQSLGFDNLWNAPIRIDAHAFTDDNSFYCGAPTGAGYIAYGNGGVDDAEDGDVVLHEYGHALQDAASLGKYPARGEPGAMGEGFGDYWAFSSNPKGKWAPCFAEWDDQGGCLRRLDGNKVYPDDIVGEVHADGEIWSRGLRDLFLKIGKINADTIILESHFLVPDSPQFADGLAALVEADSEIYGGAHKAAICSVFAARGITADACN